MRCRRGLVGATLVGAILAAWSLPAAAEHDGVSRIRADTAVERAVAYAQRVVADGGAPVALLGRDDVFADLVASAGPQTAARAPLLVTPSTALAPATADELARLGTHTVHILGGPRAVSDEVEADLRGRGLQTHRHGGATRIDTAVAIAGAFRQAAGTALLVRADASGGDPTRAFADALAAGPLAGDLAAPVLLTDTARLSPQVREWLLASEVERVVIVGGELAVSAAVEQELSQLGFAVGRVAGEDRFATAVAVARATGRAGGGIVVVDGARADAFSDAFPAALLASAVGAPIVLSAGDVLPPATGGYLESRTTTPAVVCGATAAYRACDEAAISVGAREPYPLSPVDGFERAWLRLDGSAGERVPAPAYVAADAAARQRGLMGWSSLPREAGMLFLFPGERRGGFWMKNTTIPLSIAFATSDAVVRVVMDMEPCDADPCPIHDPGIAYQYALEVNQGRFADIGLVPGWRLHLPGDLPEAR